MDSINTLKGYNKVNPEHHLQLQSDSTKIPQLPKRPIITTLLISAITSLTFLLLLMLATLIHKSKPLCTSTSNSTIQLACHVTLHPQTCFTSISSLNTSPNPNLSRIINLSLQVSISELSRLSLFLKNKTLVNSDDVAMKDCMEQVEDAMSQMKESMAAIKNESLTNEAKVVKDVQTWVSSAVTDQETCLDGLEEMGVKGVEDVRMKMKKSVEFTSNSLAIVANFDKLVRDIPLH